VRDAYEGLLIGERSRFEILANGGGRAVVEYALRNLNTALPPGLAILRAYRQARFAETGYVRVGHDLSKPKQICAGTIYERTRTPLIDRF